MFVSVVIRTIMTAIYHLLFCIIIIRLFERFQKIIFNIIINILVLERVSPKSRAIILTVGSIVLIHAVLIIVLVLCRLEAKNTGSQFNY